MKIQTMEDYVESLRNLGHTVYIRGEKVDDVTTHPLVKPHINCAGMTYELANHGDYSSLLKCKSHLTGKEINRFTHIHKSDGDLVKKVKMMRLLGQKTGSCFQRCVGYDGLNAVFATSFDMDKEYGTDYHERFLNYLRFVQERNLMVAGAMTDAKGLRSSRPSEQDNPSSFVRIKERTDEGIIVEGMKNHITGAVNSHEILVMPTMSLKEQDQDYAVCFAIPSNTRGVIFVFGRQATDARRLESNDMDTGNPRYGVVGGEASIIFNDVFVPRERIFMCGEYKFAGKLVERFTSLHRQNYGGCKVGVAEVLIGAAAQLATYHGVIHKPHIKDKLVEMFHLAQSLYSSSLACSYEGKKTDSGAYMPDFLLANVAKMNTTRFVYEIARLAHDIAGGFIATTPSSNDLEHPEIGELLKRYYSTTRDTNAENRIRLARLIENMTSGTPQVEAMHGAGSPQAQRVSIFKQIDLETLMKNARHIACADS